MNVSYGSWHVKVRFSDMNDCSLGSDCRSALFTMLTFQMLTSICAIYLVAVY